MIQETIKRVFLSVLEQTDKTLVAPEITDEMVLLESGMDSLGFAILVTLLEEELGYDPFTAMNEPVYPRTYGDFVAIYVNHNA